MAERELANQLDGMTRSAVADQRIVDADLVPVLRFIGQVVVLVQQAFGDVLASLIEFSYLRAEDLREPRRTELLSSIDNLLARSRYRDVEEICSRLHSLSELFDQAVRPKLGRLAEESEWGQVFELLDKYEGAIIARGRRGESPDDQERRGHGEGRSPTDPRAALEPAQPDPWLVRRGRAA